MKQTEKSTQSLYPFLNILDNGIVKCEKCYLKYIKVFPINYDLKSNLEKEAILSSYKIFLKSCNFNFQILIQSKKENLYQYISNLQNSIQKETNEKIINLAKEYGEFIEKKEQENISSTKEFLIIIKHETSLENSQDTELLAINDLNDQFYKIKDTLSRCGNLVQALSSKKEIEEFLINFYKYET